MTKQEIRILINKYLDGTITDRESELLHSWYNAENDRMVDWEIESENEAALLEAKMLHEIKVRTGLEESKHRHFLGKYSMRLVASVSFILLVSWCLFKWKNTESTELLTVSSPLGKVTQRTLPDSSQVWLNAGSSITYTSDFKERNIELTGEAFFDVKHQQGNPFTVRSGVLTTRVLGTAFNIKAFPSERLLTISVARGLVQVDKSELVMGVIHPNQQIEYDMESGKARSGEADLANSLAWKEGKMEFHERNLGDIAAELERWYDVRFIFKNAQLKNCIYTAGFKHDMPLESVLTLLCEINNTSFHIDKAGKQVTLSGQGCN